MTRPFTGLALALAFLAQPAAAQEISAQRLSDITRELASAPYAGRGPGGPGEGKTIDFIVGQFKALGLTPAGDNGGWTAEVPLWRYQTEPGGTYTLSAGGKTKSLHEQSDVRIETQRPVERVVIRAAPMVFVGERHWTQVLPVWPLLRALADGRPMARSVVLVDDPADAVSVLLG